MAKPKLAWWVIPGVITGSVAALGAVGTLIIGSAKWLTLPEKVEAGEQKNVQQDTALNQLSTIAEQNQKLLDKWDGIYAQQQQTHAPVPAVRLPDPDPYWWQDEDGGWWWCDPRTDCEKVDNWRSEDSWGE